MKKIIISLFFIVCAFYSFAQVDTISVNTPQSNVFTIIHFKGGVTGDYSVMISVRDTLDNKATSIKGAITVRPQDNTMWYSDGTKWLGIVANGNAFIIDSIYVENPIAVKIGTSGAALGKQVIYFLKESGLIAGGIPFSTGCRTITMPPSIYNINFNQYSSASTNLTIDTSHATLNRTDRIVGDTFGVVSVLKGTPSSLGLPPSYNPSSQFSLALIPVPAASGCTPITSKVVYDQATGVAGGEYDTSRVGSIAVDYNNLDNPFHLTKAAFISTYRDSTQLVFTNTGLQDTVTSSSVLVLPTYLNNRLTNPIQVEFFLGATSVSNNTVINSNLNTLDTGQYQVAAIPFSAFGFSSSYFNKIVFTFRGYDTSGASGLYFDWIRIQKGVTFFESNRYVDSTKIIAGNEYYYKGGIAYLAGAVGGGSGGIDTAANGLTDSLGRVILGGGLYKNTTIDALGRVLTVTGTNLSSTMVVQSSAASGIALAAASDNGIALSASAGLIPVTINSNATANNTQIGLQIYRAGSAAGTTSLGSTIATDLKNSTSSTVSASRLITTWTTATGGAEVSRLAIQLKNAGTLGNKFLIAGTGALTASNYGIGTFTGTPAYNLQVDASGNIIETTASGSSVNFKYNEEFTGSTSLTLTLSQTYLTGTIRLYKNGVRLLVANFTEASGTTITLNVPRLSGDVFTVDFNY